MAQAAISMAAPIVKAALVFIICAPLAASALRAANSPPPLARAPSVRGIGGCGVQMMATESGEDLSKLTKKALKARLQSHGLKVSGKKRVLIERLDSYIAANAEAPAVVAGLEAVEDCVLEAETSEALDECLPAVSEVLWPDAPAPLTPNFGTSEEVIGTPHEHQEGKKDDTEPSFFDILATALSLVPF